MILLTAFKNTSSEKLIKALKKYDILILENDREMSVNQLICRLSEKKYDFILAFGQRPLIKDKIHFESTARDKNGGKYSTDFSIDKALQICKEIGLTAKCSDNAGTSFCNNLYYRGLEYISSNSLKTKMCFVHIPFDKNIRDFDVFVKDIQELINRLNNADIHKSEKYICKIASINEMNIKWNFEIANHPDSQSNWIIWKKGSIENFKNGDIIPYYGILDGKIICEATAMLNPRSVQNSDKLVGADTVYLSAFRTVKEYRGKGFFSILFKFMLSDLKKKGYVRATLGVEPSEEKNKSMYKHFGFTEYIKSAKEEYPDGTVIDVDYYGKYLL